MAEVNPTAGTIRHKGAVRRCKKLSTKVDLTPMVDLGFLLITFFVFTTSLTKPTAMKLFLPADGSGTSSGKSTTLTIIPVGATTVFYYHGDLEDALKQGAFGSSNFSYSGGIGNIIREKQRALDRSFRFTRKDLMLIIKPSEDASLANITHALDEVLINVLPHYAFTDLSEAEKQALLKLNIH